MQNNVSMQLHQLSPIARQMIRQRLVAHAMKMRHPHMQMHTHPMVLPGAGPAPGISQPPMQPMLGGMPPAQ